LRAILQNAAGLALVGEAEDGRGAIELVRNLKPEVLLLDLVMPHVSGMDVLRALAGGGFTTRILLVVANVEKQQLVDALQLGVRGVVLKEAAPSELIEAIQAVVAGRYWMGQHVVGDLVNVLQHPPEDTKRGMFGLTSRELQVIAAIVEGCANKDIAQSLSVTEDTVKRHLKNIFDKVGVSSRLELALFAIHHSLVERS
jgi:DNA-binding NarL/FixJ family response regulator